MNTKTWFKVLAACTLSLIMMACSSQTPQNETQQAEGQQPKGEKAKGTRSKKSAAAGAAAKAESEPREVTVTAPEGTVLSVRLAKAIDTGSVKEGSSFDGTLAAPLEVNGVTVAATGSAVAGKVTHAVSSGRLNKPAELGLMLTSLTPTGGNAVDISTAAWGDTGESHKKRDLELIGGGGGAGALIGGLVGGKKGAAIGGAVGAGGGTAVAAGTGKKEIVLPAETKLDFKLSAAANFTMMK